MHKTPRLWTSIRVTQMLVQRRDRTRDTSWIVFGVVTDSSSIRNDLSCVGIEPMTSAKTVMATNHTKWSLKSYFKEVKLKLIV